MGTPWRIQWWAQRRVRVLARDEVVELWSSPGGGTGRLLVGSDQLDHIELWDWRLGPGDVHEAEAHAAGTAEIVHVLDGELVITPPAGRAFAAADGPDSGGR